MIMILQSSQMDGEMALQLQTLYSCSKELLGSL